MKYSGMAFEIIALLLVAVLIGQKLDQRIYPDASYFTALLVLLFLVGYLLKLYYSLNE